MEEIIARPMKSHTWNKIDTYLFSSCQTSRRGKKCNFARWCIKAKSYEVKSCETRLPVNYGERTRDFDENGRDKRKQTFFSFFIVKIPRRDER
jgi:hypothetical protein